jgi:hypothetical protein
MSENGVKTIKDFAAEIGVNRITVGNIVALLNLPTQRMTHGCAKGLPPKTQRTIRRMLRRPQSASA